MAINLPNDSYDALCILTAALSNAFLINEDRDDEHWLALQMGAIAMVNAIKPLLPNLGKEVHRVFEPLAALVEKIESLPCDQ